MKITGIIKGDKLEANSDITDFISELLSNEEFKRFFDKSHVFEDVLDILENQTEEIKQLQTRIDDLTSDVYFHKMISGKYFRYIEFGLIALTFILLISKL